MAIGAGAIAQVVMALYGVLSKSNQGMVWTPRTAIGVFAGLLVMYGTGLLTA